MEASEDAEKILKMLNIQTSDARHQKFTPSFLLYGNEKGVGKTWKALEFPGTIFAISYDGQTDIILQDKARYDPDLLKRVQTVDFYSWESPDLGDLKGERRILHNSALIMDATLKLVSAFHPDWFLIDGLPMLNERVNEGIRDKVGLPSRTSKILGQDMIAYDYRNKFYDDLQRTMLRNCQIGIIYTSYGKPDVSKIFGTDQKIPEWQKWVQWTTRNIIYLEKDRNTGKFWALLESMKGFADLGKEGTKIDVTGFRPIFPPELLLNYRKGNPMYEVKEPEEPPKEEVAQGSPAPEPQTEDKQGVDPFDF